ncbi:Diphthamide biosynthesis protein 1 [Piedraia hortae CBS 480.64]|uniref:2-(3-amino-3-carboxypropyl)histidine synthase subunit 1 n=1 Tax=Piedraia hortae CBS 480.64 TaxID=1314780 RepID=A0A6A7BVN5_9PEZI|nr:Diphthamide biosynthesis protein 1 [Piedraia hortae CBS 480.64]
MSHVTYGACCVDDHTARALGCDLLVRYAHSCLIPVSITSIKTLYVFVDIQIDAEHLVATLARDFEPGRTIAMKIAPRLRAAGYNVVVPQKAPLSKGEIIGCTSPRLSKDQQVGCTLYLRGDHFQLESAMIHNPTMLAYRYDPYSRRLTHEVYEHITPMNDRGDAMRKAASAWKWGLIWGSPEHQS